MEDDVYSDRDTTEVAGVQPSYYLVQDDEMENGGGDISGPSSSAGGVGGTVGLDGDAAATVPVAHMSQAQRQMLQEEEDAAWEGKEGSQHHQNTWLGLRRLFVTRPPPKLRGAGGDDVACDEGGADNGGDGEDGVGDDNVDDKTALKVDLPAYAKLQLRVSVVPEVRVWV